MFNSLADIITDGPTGPGRTGEPVRRHSHMAGRCEGLFWRRMDRAEARRVVIGARKYELAGRQAGQRNGPLGFVALEILDLMANLINGKTGRLDPSLNFLMATLKRSRDAIHRALKALRDHGFLDWLRRYVETGNEGRGPRVQQTSNAYRLFLPARALRLLGRAGQPAPVPDDFDQEKATRAAERASQEATLSFEDYARHHVEDDALAAVLAKLGASVREKQRESGRQAESGN